MKKVLVIAILFMFVLGAVSAFAEEVAPAAKGKPLSKVPGESTFQAAADHIALWGRSEPIARQETLRGNKAEMYKRRNTKNPMM